MAEYDSIFTGFPDLEFVRQSLTEHFGIDNIPLMSPGTVGDILVNLLEPLSA